MPAGSIIWRVFLWILTVVFSETDSETIKVGGQAVMEGVMMRSPKSFAVAVRRSGGEIVVRESPWRPILGNWRFLRWPFLRGSVVLLESMINGISALNFSARIAMADLEQQERAKEVNGSGDAGETEQPGQTEQASPDGEAAADEEPSDWVIWGTLVFALALAIGLFIALPHLAVWLGSLAIGREFTVDEFLFHLIVGVVKLGVFVGYIALISLMKDVRRVFMYHGAEHQSIYAYEAGQPLTVEYARKHRPMHPRCGTTFLLMVIGLSILVFALVFPTLIWLVGEPTGIGWLDHVLYILLKLPLLFPIAALAYEFQRLTGRHLDRRWARALAWPGMFVQKLTTRPPTDEQLEVALASLQKTLWRERVGLPAGHGEVQQVQTYPDFETLVREVSQAG